METVQLKKQIRAIDLAVAAGRARKSSRTGFVHFSPHDAAAVDVIPVYENFCFCLALFRQRSAEAVLEGKELLEKLLGFQTETGAFPAFLHDYPKCWDETLPLKIAPAMIYLLREFSSVLGASLKQRLEGSLAAALASVKKTLTPLWEMRARACRGEDFALTPRTEDEWLEWLISKQLVGAPVRGIPYYAALQALLCPGNVQEGREAQASPIEWLLAEEAGYGPRLKKGHSRQLYCALLWPLESQEERSETMIQVGENRIVWKGEEGLHSLVIEEGAVFCDLGCRVTIEGERGTVFRLGQWIEITGGERTIRVRFDLQEGQGEFLGHIARANRSSQVACKGALLYEAYDWRIAARALRSEQQPVLSVSLWSEELSIAMPIAWSPLST